MCEPTTIALAVTAVAGAFAQQRQANQRADYEQGVADYNSRVAENDAQSERTAATTAENAQRLKTARFISTQRAQLAASNIDINSGSALQIQEDTATLGEADALRIRATGDARVASLLGESELQTAAGKAAQANASNARFGNITSAVGGVLSSGAGEVSAKWYTDTSQARTINSAISGTAQIGL